MGGTGQVRAEVRSVDDLLGLAQALEQEAATRYRGLSAAMQRQGDHELAAQFDALAAMEDRHVSQIGDRSVTLLGRRPDPHRVSWETPPGLDGDEARDAELSAYRALAFAVRNEERTFAFYSYVAAEAEDAEIRQLAEDLARDELQHAALLRHYRRRAFHDKRPEAVETPETVEDLLNLARLWDGLAARAHAALAETLRAQGDADAAIFDRLAKEEAATGRSDPAVAAPALRNAADGMRLLDEQFNRYASIAERAGDENVVSEAQRLASQMILRLAMFGGARGNKLLEGDG